MTVGPSVAFFYPDIGELRFRSRYAEDGTVLGVDLDGPVPQRTAISRALLDLDAGVVFDGDAETITIRHSAGELVYRPIAWDERTCVVELVEQR